MQSSRYDLRIPAFLAGVMLVLCLASPIDAMAKKCPYPGHPSCDSTGGDGSGDYTVTAQDTRASWSGDIISDWRDCTVGYIGPNGGYSHDACDTSPSSPTVTIQFTEGDYAASGRKPELCDVLSEGMIFGDDTNGFTNRITGFDFSVSTEWNGVVCLDDGLGSTTCRIRVQNTAYGELCTEAERDSWDCGDRLIVMTGFGPAQAASMTEANPFTQDQDIDLNELTFTIKAVGKNRTEATCTVLFSPPGTAAVTFHTVAIP
jgi:hypothetical protein